MSGVFVLAVVVMVPVCGNVNVHHLKTMELPVVTPCHPIMNLSTNILKLKTVVMIDQVAQVTHI